MQFTEYGSESRLSGFGSSVLRHLRTRLAPGLAAACFVISNGPCSSTAERPSPSPMFRRFFFLASMALSSHLLHASENVSSLAGEWRLLLGGPAPVAAADAPPPPLVFDDTIVLPATLNTA